MLMLRFCHRLVQLQYLSGLTISTSNPYYPQAPSGGYKLATRLVHPASSTNDPYAASAPPLYQTATFAQPSATTFGEFDYTRSGNPTRQMLEEQLAMLEGGDRVRAGDAVGWSESLRSVQRIVRCGRLLSLAVIGLFACVPHVWMRCLCA